MPLQNRVTPFGALIATHDRGTLLGNRGLLHDPQKQVRRAWRLRRWIYCVLEFKGRHRTVMSPGRYTELFFLDEATALAAGHRPCAECKRTRYNEFREAPAAGNSRLQTAEPLSTAHIDDALRADRLDDVGSKLRYIHPLDDLRDGVVIALSETPDRAYLVQDDSLFP